MLERLEVHSLGIIDEVFLEPAAGFVALTGETGAGKSLLVESLKLLAGGRAQSSLVRTGSSSLSVQGVFTVHGDAALVEILDELGIPGGDSLVIRRDVHTNGRSRAWINDIPVTVGSLQHLAPHLLAIHGQHEQYGLADGAEQRRLVDAFGVAEALRDRVTELYQRWRAADAAAVALAKARDQRRDRLDVIAFQLAEIDAVAPVTGEDATLEHRRQLLRHAVSIRELGETLLQRLAEGEAAVIDQLGRAEREAAEMAGYGAGLPDVTGRLREARILVEESVRDIQDITDAIDDDPAELESIETRLHRLEQLMLKYGSPIDAVLQHRERLIAQREELLSVEDRLREAYQRRDAALDAYDRAARELDAARTQAGKRLLKAATSILNRLNMEGTKLDLRWFCREDPDSALKRDGRRVRFDAGGVAECELQIAPNPGEELRPMATIASGGELSRLHLALRTALRETGPATNLTLLFDEVDAGLGGAAAAALGEVLAQLAERDQVLVVTHLPQVAARATAHLRVDKVVTGGRAVTRVTPLDGEERIRELARMLAGQSVGASALEHARALIAHQ